MRRDPGIPQRGAIRDPPPMGKSGTNMNHLHKADMLTSTCPASIPGHTTLNKDKVSWCPLWMPAVSGVSPCDRSPLCPACSSCHPGSPQPHHLLYSLYSVDSGSLLSLGSFQRRGGVRGRGLSGDEGGDSSSLLTRADPNL